MSYEKGITTVDEESLISSCIRIRIELQPSISTHWKTYVLKKQISVTYMLKLLAVKTKNSCIKERANSSNERDTNSYEKAKQPAPGL